MGFGHGNNKGPISEINVTPLVDVMLVLLIIFMIAAPMMFSGINLKLPRTKKVDNINLTKDQVILSLTSSGEYYIGDQKYLQKELISEIISRFKKNQSDVVFVRADYSLSYGRVASIISHLKNSGIANISLVTEIEED